MDGRQSPPKPLWRYQYPVIDGRVQNPAVTRFITELVNVKEGSTAKTLRDFKRGIKINGKIISNDTEEDKFIEKLTLLAQKSTAYAPKDKQQLVNYLKNQGGQDNNMLVQNLIRNNHFVRLSPNETCVSSSTQNLLNFNWGTNEDGKIELRYSAEIQSIEVKDIKTGELYLLLANDDNRSIQRLPMDPELITTRKASNKGLPPLFRVDYSVELDIKNSVVEPVVREIKVTNYNNDITIQESKFADEHDPKFLSIQRLLTIVGKFFSDFKDDHEIKYQLLIIQRLIMDSNNGKNIEALRIAAEYTRNIQCRIKRFMRQDEHKAIDEIFTRTTEYKTHYRKIFGAAKLPNMNPGELIEHLGKLGISNPGTIGSASSNIEDAADIFGVIYLGLHEIYHHYHPVSSAELSNSAVATDWSHMPSIHQASEHSFNAFRNGCEINYTQIHHDSSNKDIMHLIDDLAEQFTTDSAERKLTSDWIAKNGATLPDTLIDFMLNSENVNITLPAHIGMNANQVHLSPVFEQPLHKWNMAMNGSLELTSVYYVASLYCDEASLGILRDPRTNQAVYVKSKNPVIPQIPSQMMRIETKIQLKIEEGKIIPVVTQFEAQSYTKGIGLSQPEPKPSFTNK